MKKMFITVGALLFAAQFVFAGDFNLDGGISLNDDNVNLCRTMLFERESELKSSFSNGVVVRYSTDENNQTGLGKFVEIKYEFFMKFEGQKIKQGDFSVIFSNLSRISVDEKTKIGKGTLLGKTKKKGEGNDFRVFVINDDGELGMLKMMTGNRKVSFDGLWYWSPAFMFEK